ncbi:PREDICTED: RNA-binding protein 43 [Cyprinodon variegatus]|uniref:RNA binding motif protein 43 n=1 Tax=Cyprinodon variegatus TaxID=28743 RepID=A0A3Q2FM57_CYPVA|nr:PREDICTED: RNA-binding protein 43 [Cyprinodon variegatus]
MTAAMAETRRKVVVSGVPSELEPSRMVDKLTIHFQTRRRSHGGDVELVEYPTSMNGVAFVTFDRAEDAERVVGKDQHVMMDEEFKANHRLTVFPFSSDVFLYVPRATVDLSVFGSDQASLIKSLQSAHRSIHFHASPTGSGASIEGPFSAVRALREDLLSRAGRLRPPSQTADVKPRESPLASENALRNSRGTKAKQQAANPSSFSESLLRTDEARDVRILTSGPTASFRQKVLNESLAGGSFRRADGEEMGAGMLSSPGLRRLPVEGTFSKRLLESSRNRKSPQNHLEKGSTSSASKAETSEDIWADLYTFRYIEKFHLEELNEFLNGVDISTKDIEGNELVRITLSEKQASKNFRYVVENLEAFIEFWRSKLRVHSIFYDNYKFFDKRKLVQICKSESSSFAGVLCVFEDSCVKVVGPSETSHLFCKTMKDKFSHMNPRIGKSWK